MLYQLSYAHHEKEARIVYGGPPTWSTRTDGGAGPTGSGNGQTWAGKRDNLERLQALIRKENLRAMTRIESGFKPVGPWAALAALLAWSSLGLTEEAVPSDQSRRIARQAVTGYAGAAIDTLADLVGFKTVHQEGVENATHPEFVAMKAYLRTKAEELGFDFADHGAVMLIGLGQAEARIGVVTHGDVQPAEASKWARDPFSLDRDSEPGRLVGRGAEDDKGPMACALYAMKALKDSGRPLQRRIELIVALTEESDWDPFRAFLKNYDPPEINVAFDANYPVVVAEKGWGDFQLALPLEADAPAGTAAYLAELDGGAFLSQVPETARALIRNATPELEAALRQAIQQDSSVRYELHRDGDRIELAARGVSAHSAEPWNGRNAITHLAALLGRFDWPATASSRMVRLINDLVGTGDYAERFGELAYDHPFMGRLTLTLAQVERKDGKLVAGLSLRRPAGRTKEQVERSIERAVETWKRDRGVADLDLTMRILEPYLLEDYEKTLHVPVLLSVFRHYTGLQDAQAISMGGGTNASILPGGVSFGPAMPGAVYSGHSEHEFIGREQFLLNLEMYTAALAELAL